MSSSNLYPPDRSLLLAVLVLTGGLLLVAGSIYLLAMLSEGVSPEYQSQLARVRDQEAFRSPARVARSRQSRRPVPPEAFDRRLDPFPAPRNGGLPAWRDPPPNRSPRSSSSEKLYDLDVDLSHAQLEGPSPADGVFPRREMSNDIRLGLESKKAPVSVDLRSGIDAGTGTPTTWRSEVRELNGSFRALSGALAHLDRTRGGAARSRRSRETVGAKTNPSAIESAAGPTPPSTPTQVPIGGLGWLAAAGGAYAVNRLRRRHATAPSEEE